MVRKEPDPGEIAGIEEAAKAAEHAAEDIRFVLA